MMEHFPVALTMRRVEVETFVAESQISILSVTVVETADKILMFVLLTVMIAVRHFVPATTAV